MEARRRYRDVLVAAWQHPAGAAQRDKQMLPPLRLLLLRRTLGLARAATGAARRRNEQGSAWPRHKA